jgi:hypothetical protein
MMVSQTEEEIPQPKEAIPEPIVQFEEEPDCTAPLSRKNNILREGKFFDDFDENDSIVTEDLSDISLNSELLRIEPEPAEDKENTMPDEDDDQCMFDEETPTEAEEAPVPAELPKYKRF